MSVDPQLLEVLGRCTKAEVRYFELVTFRFETTPGAFDSGTKDAERSSYLCLGKNAFWLVRPNLGRGEEAFRYEWVEKVVLHSANSTDMLLTFAYGRPRSYPERIFIISEHRATLIQHMELFYRADGMFRTAKIVKFPSSEEDLGTSDTPGGVLPFKGYKRVNFQDYTFFLRAEYSEDLGKGFTTTSGIYTDGTNGMQVSVDIYDPFPIMQLGRTGREHIRWLAMEYKQALVQQDTVVTRNQMYLKKMNLSNDVAAWVCWELELEDPKFYAVLMLLRREYVPPLMDSVQDCVIIFKAPVGKPQDAEGWSQRYRAEAHLAADSFGPRVQNMCPYSDIIQAKLDALLYDEMGYGWIKNRLRLIPDGESKLKKYSRIFVKGILKILKDGNALPHLELWDEVSRLVAEPGVCTKKSEQDLNPKHVAEELLQYPAEGNLQQERALEDPAALESINSWRARVARYLAYCVDGGLLGAKFTLADIIKNLSLDMMTRAADDTLSNILSFLLHVRPKDLRVSWELKPLARQFVAMAVPDSDSGKTPGAQGSREAAPGIPEFMQVTFTDRVMQVLLELGHAQTVLAPEPGEGCFSKYYAHLLNHLLLSECSSVDLKASICRQVIGAKDAEQGTILCPGLLHLMRGGGLFLATYACAALVNLSQASEEVKVYLMNAGIAEICIEQLQSKDDDIILYTLMLLVHLTKYVNQRVHLQRSGLIPVLTGNLTACEKDLRIRSRTLPEVCSVLGQMCVDEEAHAICDSFQAVPTLISIFEKVTQDIRPGESIKPSSTKVMSKLSFALKQLCKSRESTALVGQKIAPALVGYLSNPNNLEHKDWATNTFLLLQVLAIHKGTCKLVKREQWEVLLMEIQASQLGMVDVMHDRIKQLEERINEVFPEIHKTDRNKK